MCNMKLKSYKLSDVFPFNYDKDKDRIRSGIPSIDIFLFSIDPDNKVTYLLSLLDRRLRIYTCKYSYIHNSDKEIAVYYDKYTNCDVIFPIHHDLILI